MPIFYDFFREKTNRLVTEKIDVDINSHVVRMSPVIGKVMLIPKLADLPIRRSS